MKRGISNLRKALAAVLVAGLFLGGGTASADPIYGVYQSEEFGGDIMDGRWVESLPGGASDTPAIGNTLNAVSWDGTTLATQWELSGQEVTSATLDDVQFLGALRIEKWHSVYDGGTLLLKRYARSGDSGWWGGEATDDPYEVDVTQYTHDTQVTYLGTSVVGVYSLITLTGNFVDYANFEVTFMLAVAVKTGEGAQHPGAGYPDYLPAGYDDYGQWGIAQKIRMEIVDRTVPEPATLALLVLGGTVLLAKRRRRRA